MTEWNGSSSFKTIQTSQSDTHKITVNAIRGSDFIALYDPWLLPFGFHLFTSSCFFLLTSLTLQL